MKAIDKLQRMDVRRRRAESLAVAILREIDDHVARESWRDIHHKLLDLLTMEGVEILTDADRATIGLPPRGPDGWTAEEIVALENHRLQALLRPMQSGRRRPNPKIPLTPRRFSPLSTGRAGGALSRPFTHG